MLDGHSTTKISKSMNKFEYNPEKTIENYSTISTPSHPCSQSVNKSKKIDRSIDKNKSCKNLTNSISAMMTSKKIYVRNSKK